MGNFIGRALCEPPENAPASLDELRANLAPELELREVWDILIEMDLQKRVENKLLERLEDWHR